MENTDNHKTICDEFLLKTISDKSNDNLQEAYEYFKNNYDAFVFEGGGIRGIAFGGLIFGAEEHDLMKCINKFAGSSAGSIVSGAAAINLSGTEIIDILNKTDFESFKDDSWFVIKDFYRLYTEYGIYKGEKFEDWYKNIVVKQTGKDITFQEVFEKYGNELVITGTCLNTYTTCYFNRKDFPNMPISKAVRISMSIPVFFASVRVTEQDYVKWMPKITQTDLDNYVKQQIESLKEQINCDDKIIDDTEMTKLNADIDKYTQYLEHKLSDTEGSTMSTEFRKKVTIDRIKKAKTEGKIGVFVDGGMLNNYPIWVFDGKVVGDAHITDEEIANSKTLGFKLMTDNEKDDYKLYHVDLTIDGPVDYFTALLNSMSTQIERGYIRTGYWKRTVCIDTHNVSWLDFSLPQETKEKLIQQGYDSIHNKLKDIQREILQQNGGDQC